MLNAPICLRFGTMKWYALSLITGLSLYAQTQSSVTGSYTFDANGNRVSAGESRQVVSSTGASYVQMGTTINGTVAPLEKVEEKVLSKTETSKIVERVVFPYDGNGNPGQAQKTVTTERKNPDGSSTLETVTYRADLNGTFALSEKETKVTRPTGANTMVYEKTVARGTLNGEEVVERRVGNITTSKTSSKEDATIERRDLNGNLQTAQRVLLEKEEKDGAVKETTTTYTQSGPELKLTGQSVSETQKSKNGSTVTTVNVFGTHTAGRAPGDGLELREQQIIEKTVGAAGASTETFSIRRPALDGAVLGPVQKISERNCTGQCNTP